MVEPHPMAAAATQLVVAAETPTPQTATVNQHYHLSWQRAVPEIILELVPALLLLMAVVMVEEGSMVRELTMNETAGRMLAWMGGRGRLARPARASYRCH